MPIPNVTSGSREPIAIIGMALRVPGANSPDELWKNLTSGQDSITRFGKDELDYPEEFDEPGYIPARGIVDNIEYFDASFFGILPKEARIMDPQQRLFLELSWEAVERAGYAVSRMNRRVGIYAGAYMNSYLLANLCTDREFLDDTVNQARVGSLATEIANDKDYLATRVAYKMNFNGPTMTVGTACSTSLVAVAEACRSLRDGLCDMALAGGVTLTVPYRRGYTYTDKGINSADGHCRVFDKEASGTVFSNGAGVVMLKKLSEAEADGDHIHAVIRGIGLNNDGANKVSFAAPSVKGQVSAIRAAQLDAEIDPETISLIEAHGTGTPLGDPIEVRALNRAFREAGVEKENFCALGSLKSYIGHLDVAAGVCGLIKTALSLEKKTIPPLLHFNEIHPKIDLEKSPFYPAAELGDWEKQDESIPRRAGVSSFGVGGTNAHLVLEEAPLVESHTENAAPRVIPISAKSPQALEDAVENLKAELSNGTSEVNLAHAAWTLSTGREPFPHRCSFIASNTEDLRSALSQWKPTDTTPKTKAQKTSFLFPGQGSQHVRMAQSIYEASPDFRESFNRCREILNPILDRDLRDILFPEGEAGSDMEKLLADTSYAQPAIFAVEYSLAEWWRKMGVEPAYMIGHSVGEFVAACVAGIFSLEDALFIVATRGRLMSTMAPGAMLSVRIDAKELRSRLPDSIDLAASNAPGLSVVAGTIEEIDAFKEILEEEDVPCSLLHTSHAFHSRMMDPAVEEFRSCFDRIDLKPPSIPILSTVTADWLTEEQATDVGYWAEHLRNTVQFGDALQLLSEQHDNQLMLEVGPGQTLVQLARQTLGRNCEHLILPTCSHPKDDTPDYSTALTSIGEIWNSGNSMEWENLFTPEERQRIPLPTYPFQRKRHWVEPTPPPSKPSASGSPLLPAVRENTQPNSNLESNTSPQTALQKTPPLSTSAADTSVSPMNARPSRIDTLTSEIRSVLTHLSGIPEEELEGSASFLELGFDSLLLTQVSRSFQDAFGAQLNMRQLLSDVPSIDAVAAYLDETLPEDRFREDLTEEPAAISSSSPPAEPAVTANNSPVSASPSLETGSDQANLMQTFLTQQMALLQSQIAMLQEQSDAPSAPLPTQEQPAQTETRQQLCGSNLALNKKAPEKQTAAASSAPTTSINRDNDTELTPTQRRHLDQLIASYTVKTERSKELTAENRQWFADPRTVSGFNRLWKEMIYQIVVHKSKGSRLIDVDGNEYVDCLNGFGPGFLGHSPDFITDALHEQLDHGVVVGPQNETAMEAARLFCEVTGNERASFVNTGSEAVQAAMRLARTVTGRDKIVTFARDYHGNFDEVLVRGVGSGESRRSMPLAPGIPNRAVDDIIVLPYGTDESLNYIREHCHELAAVLVEPIQSRRPEFQPTEFVRELRTITREAETALIFDEVITGFRAGPHGAQGFYGVEADLATYGKICGGGMPIGVVAGKAEFMDTFDGGQWQYGDDSFPEKGVTFFAGTFVRHPLAMVAAKQMLLHLKQEGPALWEKLNAKADRLAQTVDRLFVENDVPFRLPNFGSLLFIRQVEDNPFANLLFFHLRNKGVFLLEGFPCYLTTAHTDEDIDYVIDAFRESVAELQAAEFFPRPERAIADKLNGARLSGPPTRLAPNQKTPQEKGTAITPLTEPLAEVYLASSVDEKASLCFNEIVVLTLEGDLQLGALESALQEVVDRHDALRSVFLSGGEGFQIQPHLEIPLDVVDYSGEENPELCFEKELTAERRRLFDLEKGPLLRARLFHVGENRHIVLLNAHHLVCDGASFNEVISDLSQLYNSRVRNKPVNLEKAPSFLDYARRTHLRENSATGGSSERYWLEKFREPIPPLSLPLDKARPEEPDYRVAAVRKDLDRETVLAMRKVAGASGATFFSLLLGTFQILIGRICRQDRVFTMFPAAGQSLPGNEGIVGHCVNFLPFVSEINSEQPVSDFLAETQQQLLDALEHQDYTFGQLLKALPASERPQVDVAFNLERMDRHEDFEGLTASVDDPHRDFGINPLFLNAIESESGVALNLAYQTALFSGEIIEQWLETFVATLESIAGNSNQKVGELQSVLTESQRKNLDRWNQTETDYPKDTSISDLFQEIASSNPDNTAISFSGESITYLQLSKRVNRVASALADRGVGLESRVALYMERSPESVIGALAILSTGAAYVPLDPEYPVERLRVILEDSEAEIILTSRKIGKRLPEHSAELMEVEVAEKIGKSAPGLQHISGAQPACILYTSGSTGTPKGTIIPHRAIARLVRNSNYCPFGPEHTFLHAASICFDASLFEIYGPILNGGKLVIPPSGPLSLDTLADTIQKNGVSILWLTSGLFQLLVEENIDAFAGVRKVLTGGDLASAEHFRTLLEKYPELKLVNAYGPTESTTFVSTHLVTNEDIEAKSIPIGRPLSNSTIWILDPEGRPVPPGVPGELCCGGDGVALGYLDRPDLNKDRFIPDPFSQKPGSSLYRTGDLCRYRADGTVEFIGRIDHQVKIRGFRVEPGEIETMLSRHAEINQCKVIVQGSGAAEKVLTAYVSPFRGHHPEPEVLRDYLRSKLPEYMVPTHISVLDELPINPNGKIDTQALLHISEKATVSTEDCASNETQAMLTRHWEEILRVSPISLDDDFFALGGHSLLGMKLFSQIQKTTGLALPLSLLFQYPTIRQLARELDKRENRSNGNGHPRAETTTEDLETPHTTGYRDISETEIAPSGPTISESTVLLQSGSPEPPLFGIHGGDGGVFFYRNLAELLDRDRAFYAFEASVLTNGGEIIEEPVEETAARYLKDLNRIQPDGPVHLCGYSFGGIVAFEMARQLESAGREVHFVGLIDTENPAVEGRKLSLSERVAVNWKERNREDAGVIEKVGNLGKRVSTGLGYRLRFGAEGTMGRILPTAKQTGWLRQIQVRQAYERAMENYTPGTYAGDITVFRAQEGHDKFDLGETYGWSEVVGGKIATLDVPGNHISIFHKANIEGMARALRGALRKMVEKK